MKTSNKLLLFLLIVILLGTTAFLGATRYYYKKSIIVESGEIVDQKIPIQGFTKLNVSGNIKVILSPNIQPSLEIKGDKNLIKNVVTNLQNGELLIKTNLNVKSRQIIEVIVSTVSIEGIDFSSGSSLASTGIITSKKLNLRFSTGSTAKMEVSTDATYLDCDTGAEIQLKGSTGYFQVNASTGAIIDASNFLAHKGNISGSTGSVMNLNITDEVEADLSTGSIVRNAGTPVNKRMELSTGGVFTKK